MMTNTERRPKIAATTPPLNAPPNHPTAHALPMRPKADPRCLAGTMRVRMILRIGSIPPIKKANRISGDTEFLQIKWGKRQGEAKACNREELSDPAKHEILFPYRHTETSIFQREDRARNFLHFLNSGATSYVVQHVFRKSSFGL